MSAKVAIVILNWNGASLLPEFLPSVVQHSLGESVQIVVADNGSTDNSPDLVTERFPEVKLLNLRQNYGFALGYNEALKQIDADYYVLLNSDVEVTANWLHAPIELLQSHPEIGVVQPKILSYRQKSQYEYAGAAGGFIDRFGFPFCRGRIFNQVEEDQGQYDQPTDIFWGSGACLFIRAKLYHEAGGFDADFWAHMEEIDLCWRLINKGYRIVFTPASTVYHLGGGSLPYHSPRKLYLNFRNNLWLLYKNLPSGALFFTLFFRMALDGIAAVKLLTEFNLNGIRSVVKAHIVFYRSLPALHKKRRQTRPARTSKLPTPMLRKSIVYQFYIRRKKTYSSLF